MTNLYSKIRSKLLLKYNKTILSQNLNAFNDEDVNSKQVSNTKKEKMESNILKIIRFNLYIGISSALFGFIILFISSTNIVLNPPGDVLIFYYIFIGVSLLLVGYGSLSLYDYIRVFKVLEKIKFNKKMDNERQEKLDLELNKLQYLLDTGRITQIEYEKLRIQIINKSMN